MTASSAATSTRPPACRALRASNLIAIAMLYLAGARWARYTDAVPWKVGLLLAGIGLGLVLVAIPLGG